MLEAIDRWDHAALTWVAVHLHSAWLDPLMRTLSSIAAFAWLIAALALWLLWRGGDRGRILVVAALFLVLLTDQLSAAVIKPLVGRPRPHGGGSLSFPSVHAANIMAQATLFARFYPRLSAVFVTIALLVGFSRVYLEKHYPSDVVGGALIGAGCGLLVAWAAKRWGDPAAARTKAWWARKKLRSMVP